MAARVAPRSRPLAGDERGEHGGIDVDISTVGVERTKQRVGEGEGMQH